MDFEKEVSEIYPWILRVAKRFCRSMQDAEDLWGIERSVFSVIGENSRNALKINWFSCA